MHQNQDHVLALQTDGIVGVPGAMSPAWAQQTLEDFNTVYAIQAAFEGGTVSRGRNRRYLAVHPQWLRGFVELATHPFVTGMCAELLGPGWQLCEVGFDVPFPGSLNQPWHRDFPMPPETRERRHFSSLAFNLSTVDVTPDMGPFEVVLGTQFDDDEQWAHGMFPRNNRRYTRHRVQRLPKAGDMSMRSGLTLHRGTANRSRIARPVLILGAVAAHVDTAGEHDMVVTREYYESLPQAVRDHLRVTQFVDELTPLVQRHTIEGLVMGDE